MMTPTVLPTMAAVVCPSLGWDIFVIFVWGDVSGEPVEIVISHNDNTLHTCKYMSCSISPADNEAPRMAG